MRYAWVFPALAAVAFLALSIWTIAVTGQPTGFWVEHTRNPWGAQIGINLLNSIVAGLALGVPLGQRYGFRSWPYVVLALLTGSPGVLALAARVLYARFAESATQRSERSERSGVPLAA